MKTLVWLGSVMLILAMGCAPSPSRPPELSLGTEDAIFGGIDSAQEHFTSRHTMLIYDKMADAYCTGMLIEQNLILTAAHCIKNSPENISLAFGNRPLAGQYIMRTALKVMVHPQYNKVASANRHDLALILVKGAAPAGYSPLVLPDDSFPLDSGLPFTAAGFGRLTGKKDPTGKDIQGAGTLRYVDLKVGALSSDELQYSVDQTEGRGICNGDSGGPAIMHYQGRDYAVGVASAISWTVPADLTSEQKLEYMILNDVCRKKSIYINIKKYHAWIVEASKQLLN